MTVEKLPPTGGEGFTSQASLAPRTSSPELKLLSGRVSGIGENSFKQIEKQLENLIYNDTLNPQDITVQLNGISREIDRLTTKSPAEVRDKQKLTNLFKAAKFNDTFPLAKTLYYGRN